MRKGEYNGQKPTALYLNCLKKGHKEVVKSFSWRLLYIVCMGRDRYAVVECVGCGKYLALDCKVGFRKCPYCGYVNRLGVSRVVKKFKSPKEASELVKVLNSFFR